MCLHRPTSTHRCSVHRPKQPQNQRSQMQGQGNKWQCVLQNRQCQTMWGPDSRLAVPAGGSGKCCAPDTCTACVRVCGVMCNCVLHAWLSAHHSGTLGAEQQQVFQGRQLAGSTGGVGACGSAQRLCGVPKQPCLQAGGLYEVGAACCHLHGTRAFLGTACHAVQRLYIIH